MGSSYTVQLNNLPSTSPLLVPKIKPFGPSPPPLHHLSTPSSFVATTRLQYAVAIVRKAPPFTPRRQEVPKSLVRDGPGHGFEDRGHSFLPRVDPQGPYVFYALCAYTREVIPNRRTRADPTESGSFAGCGRTRASGSWRDSGGQDWGRLLFLDGDSLNGESIATSIIVSGGYEDDEDAGDVIVYTGQGGQDKNGRQVKDQRLERGNLAMERNMHYGIEVRVIRDFKYEGSCKVYVYDGLYKVVDNLVQCEPVRLWCLKVPTREK
ncbi:SU(VAR)3-9 homolog 9 [Striga asiatica]|uniref:SU(VAR)3-9 homolog 9 n=1 Tax=Striga asiatica TaxID=4170 RepID=A0A5A7QSK9_STRAF|nr:SU(VAR)3-9 homolog 9 [Striga asiatica]